MATFAHVQTKQQSPTTATSLNGTASISETFAATPTVGNLVLVYISHFNATADQLSTVTDNQTPHNTWTIVSARPRVGGGACAALAWSVLSQASGTFTVTANFSATSDASIGISEFSGNADAASVADGSAATTGVTTAPTSSSLTPSQANDLFVSVINDDDGDQTYTQPTSWSKRAENVVGSSSITLGSASFIATDALAKQAVWTITFSNWGCLIAAFKAAGGTTYNDSITEAANARDAFPAVGPPISTFQSTTLAFELDAFQIITGTGTTFNDSISEAGNAADALSNTQLFANTLTEAVAAADSFITIATFPNALTETLTAADSLTPAATFPNAISESVSAADSLVGGLLLSATVTETASAADSLSNVVTWGPAVTEAVSAADALTTTASFPNSISEAGSATDLLSAGLVFNEGITEALGSTTVVTGGGVVLVVDD